MSVRREQDKDKGTGRGLGLAAAAIGVGVGAALFYYLTKGPENPDGQGSTSSRWQCEQPLIDTMSEDESSDSYTTISENSTSDTSMLDDSTHSIISVTSSSISEDSVQLIEPNESDLMSLSNSYEDANYISSDEDFEMTHSSFDIPTIEPTRTHLIVFGNNLRSLMGQLNDWKSSYSKNRERSWSLEECSICFEVMLKNQELMNLPCTHNFHAACIMPWLEQQQTCPNCRKAA